MNFNTRVEDVERALVVGFDQSTRTHNIVADQMRSRRKKVVNFDCDVLRRKNTMKLKLQRKLAEKQKPPTVEEHKEAETTTPTKKKKKRRRNKSKKNHAKKEAETITSTKKKKKPRRKRNRNKKITMKIIKKILLLNEYKLLCERKAEERGEVVYRLPFYLWFVGLNDMGMGIEWTISYMDNKQNQENSC